MQSFRLSHIFHFHCCIRPSFADEGNPQVIESPACIWIYCVVLGCFRFSRGLLQKKTDESHKSCRDRGVRTTRIYAGAYIVLAKWEIMDFAYKAGNLAAHSVRDQKSYKHQRIIVVEVKGVVNRKL